METKSEKITEEKINKACENGFFDYLVAKKLSIWIDGKKVQIMDVSKHPERSETHPMVKAIYEIGDVVQKLIEYGEINITFDSGCCLFKFSGFEKGDSTKVEVISIKSEGNLLKFADNSLKFEIGRIDFITKNKNY